MVLLSCILTKIETVKKILDSISKNILLLLFTTFVLADGFITWEIFSESTSKLAVALRNNPWLFSEILFIELTILFTAFQALVIAPVRSIKGEIAKFLTGQKTQEGMKHTKALNSDVEFLQTFFGKSLEILKAFKEEYRSGRMLKSEVQLAADLQKNILKQSSVSLASLDIVGNTKSATEVGGDSYDIITR